MPALSHFGVLFQGVVIAFTVFLGRIYVLVYYDTLGVPVSEARLSVIDYVIVSPGVTVMGIGLSILLGAYFLLHRPLERLPLPNWARFRMGLVSIAAGLVMLAIRLLNIDTDPVINSLWIVFSLAMSLYGGSMLGSVLNSKAKQDGLESEQKRVEERAVSRLLLGILAIALVILYGVFAYRFSDSTAHDDAMDALYQSPQASVQFASGDSESFRVIMIGQQFIYLLPEDGEDLQAFPHGSISQIDYIGQSEP